MLWIRRHEPEVWARTRRILNGCGYLVLRLTGQAVIDVYDAALFAPFFDPSTQSWRSGACAAGRAGGNDAPAAVDLRAGRPGDRRGGEGNADWPRARP